MRLLIDTHILLWWRGSPQNLSPRARGLLQDPANEVLVSAVTTAELAIKASIGKLQLPEPAGSWVARVLEEDRFDEIPLRSRHAARLESLPLLHQDPFDRMLVAVALDEGIPLLSSDDRLAGYPIVVLT